jgi:hypothetical protein
VYENQAKWFEAMRVTAPVRCDWGDWKNAMNGRIGRNREIQMI